MKKLTVGIVAHVDAGKTTLSESLLYAAGAIRSLGRVDRGDTFLDTDAMERERGITIFSKQARLHFQDIDMVLLDTPGHVDFSAEMERTLQVLDYAILVISGLDGVQGHTKTLWRLLHRYHVPVFLFCNKMDIATRTQEELIREIQKELDSSCVDCTGIGQNTNMPDDDVSEIQAPPQLLEEMAMCQEELLEAYMEQGTISLAALRQAVAARDIYPCYFGSALKSQGVEAFLGLMGLLTQEKSYPDTFAAQVYKIGRDVQGNRITYLKLTGGCLKVKQEIQEEKVNQLRLYSGEKYQLVQEIYPGEICGVTGLENTYPGQGLGAQQDSQLPVLEPVLNYRVIPPQEISQITLLQDMKLLQEEDPMLHVTWQEAAGEVHISLMGPVQIEIIQREVKERFHYLITFDTGRIVYKETIAQAVEGVGHFEPLRHYAEVHLLMEPLPTGEGLDFAIQCRQEDLDKNWQRLVYTHLTEKEHLGVLTGSPITDMRITLITGRAHQKHTEGGDFRQATYRAVRQGLKKANSILLEPYYKVELRLPTEYLGRAMTDLQQVHGGIMPPESQGEYSILTGRAPVAEIADYPARVREYTRGQGELQLQLLGYFPCQNQDEVVASIGYDSEADIDNPTGSVFCAHGAGYIVPWYEVEEHMQVLSPLAKEQNDAQQQVIFLEKQRRSAKPQQEYDGYGGLESDLQEIFEKTFGPVKHRLPSQEIRIQSYDRQTQAKEEYMKNHKNTSTRKKERRKYLLVDGYNVIFAWPELAELSRDNLDSARGRLMDLMCNYQGFLGRELILVFDAYKVKDNPGQVLNYHNIHVVYTKEAETADAYIERVTHDMARDHDVIVATSDALEQMIVIGEGARRMSSRELYEDMLRVVQDGLESYRQNGS